MHKYLSSIAGANSILRSASRPWIGGIKDVSPKTTDPGTKKQTKKNSNHSKELLMKMKPQKDVTQNYSDIFTNRTTHIKPEV